MPKKKLDYSSLFTLRKDGRYMGYWHDGDGKRHAVYDRDPERLYQKIQEAENQPPKEITFKDLALRWKNEHFDSLARSTQTSYRAPLERCIEEFGDTPVTDIAPEDIKRVMLEEKAKGYSYKHAAAKKSILKQIFDVAVIDKNIPIAYNPATVITVPRGMKKGRIEAPKTTEVERIIKNLDKPFGNFVALLLYAGLRTEEAVALRWSDIKDKDIHIHAAVDLHGTPILKETKTDAGERYVPLLPQLKPFLRRPKSATPHDFIFNDNGKLLTRSQITKKWIAWCKEAGLAEQKRYTNRHRGKKECVRTEWRPAITPHQLRHNYATVLYEQKVDLLTAKDIMGHKDIATTQRIYTSLRQQHRDEETAKIAGGFTASSK